LCRKTYYDLNIRRFHEKPKADQQIELSYSWVQQALQSDGWWPDSASAANTGRCS
jgi:hypothetical protein